MKKSNFVVVGGLFTAIVVGSFGFSNQPPSGLTGAPDEALCTNCHVSNPINDGVGEVSLSSSGGIFYESNQTYQMTLHMERHNANGFGFSLCALDSVLNDGGSLVITDSVATMLENFGRSYVSHLNAVSDENLSQGSVDRQFNWIAPDTATGPITFYYVSHMVDTGLEFTIDGHVYNDSLTIYPIGTEGVGNSTTEIELETANIYPNPIKRGGDVMITGTHIGEVVRIYNIHGKLIKSTVSGLDMVKMSTVQFVPGVYFLSIHSDNEERYLSRLVVN